MLQIKNAKTEAAMFKRKIYDELLNWKNESNGKTALLIEGARRIGKSTIAEAFAANEYKSYILVDFAFAPENVKKLFNDLTDLNYIFLQLQLIYRKDLYERDSLIVFDEVQFCPMARQAIKLLVKDGRYDYLETGSLISIHKNVKDILIPSEERRISMYPMDFEEFLWAVGDTATVPLIHKFFDLGRELGNQTNRRVLRDYRLYMLVGGMPQAVAEYINTNNFRKVDLVKRDILALYKEDFNKIDPSGKAALLFDAIPAQLNSNASRYNVSSVLKNERADDVADIIFEMKESGTVLVSYHANDPNVGMSGTRDISRFKLFVCDTGLFVTLMFKDKNFTENSIYESLLNDKLSANLGYLYENVVAQSLASHGNELFYYTFPTAESRHNYEVDFLLAGTGNKIRPVEVKSSGYKSHKSLDAFTEKYSGRIEQKYLIYTKDYFKSEGMLYLPVYMAQFI